LIPEGHTATMYRTQFLNKVKDTQGAQDAQEGTQETQEIQKELIVEAEAPKSVSPPIAQTKLATVVPPSKTGKK